MNEWYVWTLRDGATDEILVSVTQSGNRIDLSCVREIVDTYGPYCRAYVYDCMYVEV